VIIRSRTLGVPRGNSFDAHKREKFSQYFGLSVFFSKSNWELNIDRMIHSRTPIEK